ADYLTLPVRNLHPLPDGITDEEAVFIEPLAAAFEITEQVNVGAGERVCVLGDGRLGLLVAQALSTRGCDLVAVGRHPEKLSILSGRGIKTALGAQGLADFDMTVDCTGSAEGFDEAVRLTRPGGVVVLKTTVAGRSGVDLNRVVIDEITVIGSRCGPFKPAIAALAEKKVDVSPLISKVFPIEQGVEALEYAARKGVLKVILDLR
ncbi:MAG: zinc-binding dehydrogenase, partial [Thermodesulfobacteriota bacterium]